MAFYVLDDNNNKVEAFDKEGVLAVLEQAIADGSLANIAANSAFVSKIKCCVGGDTYKMAFITQAKYNELVKNSELTPNTYYFIVDDTTYEDMVKDFEALTEKVNDAVKKVDNLTYIFEVRDKYIETRKDAPVIAVNDTRIKNSNFIEIFPLDEWTNYYLGKYYLSLNVALGEVIIAIDPLADPQPEGYPFNFLIKCTEANLDSNVSVKGFVHRAIYEYTN